MKTFNSTKERSILFVSQSFYPEVGGVSTLLFNLSHYLAKMNYKVYAIHFEVSNILVSKNLDVFVKEYIISRSEIPKRVFQGYAFFKEEIYQHLHGLKPFRYQTIEDIPGYEDFLFCSNLFSKLILNIISHNNIDIVHFHDYQVMPGLSIIPLGVKSILSLHAPLINSIDKTVAKWLVKYGNKADKMVFSMSQYSKIAIKYGLKIEKSIIIPPIIDKDVMIRSAELPDILKQIPQDAIVALCVQRFDSKSGQIQLIKAFSKISKKYQNSYLVLVGGKSFTDNISDVRKNYFLEAQNLVRKLNLAGRVIFNGNIDYMNLSQIYKFSDIVIMLSKMECFGLAITEAMFHGKPLLVTDIGGLAFQVRNGINGYTVKPGDINSTSKLLGILMDSKKLRIKMGKKSKKIFQENFRPERIIKDYHNLYQSLFSMSILNNSLNYDDIYNSLR